VNIDVTFVAFSAFAFSALTMLVGRQEGHAACKILEWWGTGVVICLERDADLHIAQLMPLPLTVSCFSKIQVGFTFLILAYPRSHGKRVVERVCVCVLSGGGAVSCSSQAAAAASSQRLQSRSSSLTTSSLRSSGSSRLLRGVRPLRTESTLSRADGDSLVVASDAQRDCTLVGYRKVDISRHDFRPTVELGTLTSVTADPRVVTPRCPAALVGTGVVMQPSLLFSAVSLPALHSGGSGAMPPSAADISMSSTTGSMPALAAADGCGAAPTAGEMPAYWRSQHGKAQLVAQHSSEATAAVTAATGDVAAGRIGDVVASDVGTVDFSLDGDPNAAAVDDDDLDMTVGGESQRAAGNDLYMAEGVDLDSTVATDDAVHTAALENSSQANEQSAAAAVCESGPQPQSFMTTEDVSAPAADAADTDRDEDRDEVEDASGGNKDRDSDKDRDQDGDRNKDEDKDADAGVLASAVERQGQQTAAIETYAAVVAVETAGKDTATPATDDAAAAAASESTVSSSSCADDNITAATDKTSVDESCSATAAQSSSDAAAVAVNSDQSAGGMNQSSNAAAVANSAQSASGVSQLSDAAAVANSNQSASGMNQSSNAAAVTNSAQSASGANRSPDSERQCVGDVTVDELSVVIPSSCDSELSMSDDERYMSGQCTLMDLIHEADATDRRLQQQRRRDEDAEPETSPRQRALGVSDFDVADSPSHGAANVVSRPHAAAAYASQQQRRLVSVVSDATVQFIGAKEKLRRQLGYAGHFYRSSLTHSQHYHSRLPCESFHYYCYSCYYYKTRDLYGAQLKAYHVLLLADRNFVAVYAIYHISALALF